MIDSRDTFMALLPADLRRRDLAADGTLHQLLGIVADQVVAIERDLAQMYDDWFIETCADWVVPYLGDLLGYRGGGSSASLVPRREVGRLLAHRRRSGTAHLIGELAADAAAWPSLVVELHRRLVVAQHLDHVHADRPGTIDVHDPRAFVAGAIDGAMRLNDVRRPSAVDSPGRASATGVLVVVSPLRAYTVTSTAAYCREDVGAHCFAFSVLGNEAPLYRHDVPVVDGCGRSSALPAAHAITRLEIEADAPADDASAHVDAAFYGAGRSFALTVVDPRHGVQPVPLNALIPADLSTWAYRVPRDRVAIDPVLGRIMFPTSQAPRGGVRASYAYGFAMDLGGGEYRRGMPASSAAVSRRRVRSLDAGPPAVGEFPSIEAAVADWRGQRDAETRAGTDPRRASALPALVVELVDSGLYRGALAVSLGRGESLAIVAAEATRPVLWLTDENAGGADAIAMRGARGSRFRLDGVLVAGRGVIVGPALDVRSREAHDDADRDADEAGDEDDDAAEDDLCEVVIRHCTLVPGWGLSHDCEPRRPSEPSLTLDNTRACVSIERSIVGAIRIDRDDVDGPPARIEIADSIVDATSETRTAIGALGDLIAHATVSVARSTIVGTVLVHAIDRVENSLFVGPLTVARKQTGCVRYCFVPRGSRTPQRYRCQPDDLVAAIAAPEPSVPGSRQVWQRRVDDTVLRNAPRFMASRYGSPHYLRLTDCTSRAIARGADDGAQMGVYHDLFEAQRLDRLARDLDDALPAGLDAAVTIRS